MFSSLCQAEKCRNVDKIPLGKKFFELCSAQTWLGCCAPPGVSPPLAGSPDPRNLAGSLPEAAGLERSLSHPPTQGTVGEAAEGAPGLGRWRSLAPGERD